MGSFSELFEVVRPNLNLLRLENVHEILLLGVAFRTLFLDRFDQVFHRVLEIHLHILINQVLVLFWILLNI